ncbi:alpha/beta hydrolase [Xylocopilactobacillus apis]|uniref:Alpha/beta hydrolase n=1 Tax=Xylocopilactobacillus apis TaxID=2932183 RepID=A0AAU9D2B2_9LACO|nr:alpha/beta hydrolase [Xylocopilactobacillus apis]BDR56420.1 alpha/beta hydrolase [Xylocopilactobacillus apis]
MTKKKHFSIVLSLLFLLFIITGCSSKSNNSAVVKSTPTLFIHGWGSSINAEHQMTNSIQNAKISNSVTQALVDSKGKVKLVGQIPSDAKNPLVEVGFEDNKSSGDYHQNGRWLKNVIEKLQQTYHIKNVNLVGHSMGNMAIVYYLLDNYNNHKLPKVLHQVDIAGHFNGIIGIDDKPNQIKLNSEGRPDKINKNYQDLLGLRNKYPYKQIKVLNIFGDKNNGTHSDDDVTNSSSQSLKYLLNKRALSYQEKKIVGPEGQHSRLHENKEVDQILMKFLWP